jgi:hypothetical protein
LFPGLCEFLQLSTQIAVPVHEEASDGQYGERHAEKAPQNFDGQPPERAEVEGMLGPEEPVAEGMVGTVVPVRENLRVDGRDSNDVAVREVGGIAEIHLGVCGGADERGIADGEQAAAGRGLLGCVEDGLQRGAVRAGGSVGGEVGGVHSLDRGDTIDGADDLFVETEIDAGDRPPENDEEGPETDGVMEIEVDATPVAAHADGEATGRARNSLPPEKDSGHAEDEKNGGADGVDLLAVCGAQQEEGVEVMDPLHPGAGLGMERRSDGVGYHGELGVGSGDRVERVGGKGGPGGVDVGDTRRGIGVVERLHHRGYGGRVSGVVRGEVGWKRGVG